MYQRLSSMSFIESYCKLIMNWSDCCLLSNHSQLRIKVVIVSFPFVVFIHDEFKSLFELGRSPYFIVDVPLMSVHKSQSYKWLFKMINCFFLCLESFNSLLSFCFFLDLNWLILQWCLCTIIFLAIVFCNHLFSSFHFNNYYLNQ
jgi:hypothetical protein